MRRDNFICTRLMYKLYGLNEKKSSLDMFEKFHVQLEED